MTALRKAAQQALEALDRVMSHGSAVQDAKDILQSALAEPLPERYYFCPMCNHWDAVRAKFDEESG